MRNLKNWVGEQFLPFNLDKLFGPLRLLDSLVNEN